MSTTIKIELCEEDRARLDKIIERLGNIGHHPDCSKCVKDVAGLMDKACEIIDKQPKPVSVSQNEDELKKMLEKAIGLKSEVKAEYEKEIDPEALRNAQEATENSAPVITPKTEKKPEAKESAPKVSLAELKAKVIKLMAVPDKREKVKAIVFQYAKKVTEVPEDKWAECYQQLTALEG